VPIKISEEFMAKVAVVLSGCGHLDGSEIHEAVLCLLELSLQGHSYLCFAPNKQQAKTMNHFKKELQPSLQRNILVESARIARGKIHDLKMLNPKEFDALILPGGFGAALNLCTYGEEKENCEVDSDLKKIIEHFFELKKPIGATCIATVILAKVLSPKAKIKMTLGYDAEANSSLKKMGAEGVPCHANNSISDEQHKVYTTPCYMEQTELKEMKEGIESLIFNMFK